MIFLSRITGFFFSIGSSTIFAKACVTSKRIGMVGCTVVVNYTIEG